MHVRGILSTSLLRLSVSLIIEFIEVFPATSSGLLLVLLQITFVALFIRASFTHARTTFVGIGTQTSGVGLVYNVLDLCLLLDLIVGFLRLVLVL